MRKARVGDRLVEAGPSAPEVGICPECGGEVRKRRRRRMDKLYTWYYRHKEGSGKDCPKRYSPRH